MRIKKVSQKLIDHVKDFEGFEATPYLCPAKIPTVGYGSTTYENGSRVRIGDPAVTVQRAESMLRKDLEGREITVDSFTRDDITQGMFDALVDFAYNCGSQNLKTSTLLKKVNTHPGDPTIGIEFMKWVFGGDGTHNGKDDDKDGLIDEASEKQRLNGLVRRREAEAKMYFS
jgi:lysozyme